jgi:hypothetical membrane protein
MDWITLLQFIKIYFPFFGIGGSLLILLCMGVTGLVYRGKKGEKYSLFNHYISELGEVGVSKAAAVFNFGLIIAGLAFIPFIIGLGLTIGNVWAKIGLAVGIISTISCALVGVFPMNHLKAHYWVAITYFRTGLVMVFLFTVAVFAQPAAGVIFPKASNLAGLLTFLCYAAFLLITRPPKEEGEEPESNPDPQKETKRPKYSRETILEWAVFFSTTFWFLILALFAL